ncbi:Hypothetical protein PACV_430 [Pacmanvirus A23]|uniref:Hypothetical protein n=1 Tax=Pacmanvirus A23 TaxID=1932881 RepID=UPI000A093D48|nr:Hypothetical protein B9W72_gp426 [Pacmanvirus A23]SIP86143.1 Hypothetical protein PACV_430 [Pacmanvirus A23]
MDSLPNELWEQIIPITIYDRTTTHLVCWNWFNLAIDKLKRDYQYLIKHKKLFTSTLNEISSIEYRIVEKLIDESRSVGPGDIVHDVEINCKLVSYESVRQYKNKASYAKYIYEDYIVNFPINQFAINNSSEGIYLNTIYYEIISRNEFGIKHITPGWAPRLDTKINDCTYKFDINCCKYGLRLEGRPKNCTYKLFETTLNHNFEIDADFPETAILYNIHMCYIFKD